MISCQVIKDRECLRCKDTIKREDTRAFDTHLVTTKLKRELRLSVPIGQPSWIWRTGEMRLEEKIKCRFLVKRKSSSKRPRALS